MRTKQGGRGGGTLRIWVRRGGGGGWVSAEIMSSERGESGMLQL
jgi:hypothetical protein